MATIEVIAKFPTYSFLENLYVRPDGSILVTVPKIISTHPNTLYLVPTPVIGQTVKPVVLKTFEDNITGIVEITPGSDEFALSMGNVFLDGPQSLWRLDMRSFDINSPEISFKMTKMTDFPTEADGLNGSCMLSSNTILLADSFADCIWRFDIEGTTEPNPRMWVKHDLLSRGPNPMFGDKKVMPQANGLKYDARGGYVYFTCTTQSLFGRVKVDRETLDATSEPEIVARDVVGGDDLIIDGEGGYAYVATHRANTIERIVINDATGNFGAKECVLDLAGHDATGPTAGQWCPGQYGKAAYFSTDGGIKTLSGEDNIPIEAKLIKVTFA